MTIVAMIGNSDDELTQEGWLNFMDEFQDVMLRRAIETHGIWFSHPLSEWQNMAICVEMDKDCLGYLKLDLKRIAGKYDQDSIALLVGETEFVKP